MHDCCVLQALVAATIKLPRNTSNAYDGHLTLTLCAILTKDMQSGECLWHAVGMGSMNRHVLALMHIEVQCALCNAYMINNTCLITSVHTVTVVAVPHAK